MKKLKRLIKFLVASSVLLVVLVVAAVFFLDRAVLHGVNAFGPRVVGVPVTLDDVVIRPVRGEVRMKNLVIGNPEGYKTDHAIKLGAMSLDMQPQSLLSKNIRISRIVIDGPEIVYEVGLGNSNLSTILESLESDKEPGEADAEEAKVPNQKVEIDEIVVQNGTIRISAKLLQGHSISLPLPTITLHDIGKDEAASLVDTIKNVLTAIIGSSLNVVKASGVLIGKGVGIVGDVSKAGVDVLGKGIKTTGEGIGKAFHGIGSLFGSDDETNETEKTPPTETQTGD